MAETFCQNGQLEGVKGAGGNKGVYDKISLDAIRDESSQ